MGFSTYGSYLGLLGLLGQAQTAVATKVSLHTADPGTTGGSEVSSSNTGYAQVDVAATAWTVANNSRSGSNTSTVTFPDSTASWGTVSHFGLWRGTNFIGGGTINNSSGTATPVAVGANKSVRFNAGELEIEIPAT